MKLLSSILACVVVAGALCLTGCCGNCKVKTGTIDSAAFLQGDEEYEKIAQQYFDERMALAIEVRKAAGKDEAISGDQYLKFAKAEQELNQKWLAKTRGYVTDKMVGVRAACQKVCEDKQIDIVILNSSEMPTVEYGAVDITSDVIEVMPGMAGAGTAPAEADSQVAKEEQHE